MCAGLQSAKAAQPDVSYLHLRSAQRFSAVSL
jgi:hypothetical protein